MIYVMTAKGKGIYSTATSIQVDAFENIKEANAYIERVTDTEDKYWTIAETIQLGAKYEAGCQQSGECYITDLF